MKLFNHCTISSNYTAFKLNGILPILKGRPKLADGPGPCLIINDGTNVAIE